MSAGLSPWSTFTEPVDGAVRVSVLLTTDAAGDPAGGVREYRRFLDLDLDETHALILFGELGRALQALADRREPANDRDADTPRKAPPSVRAAAITPTDAEFLAALIATLPVKEN